MQLIPPQKRIFNDLSSELEPPKVTYKERTIVEDRQLQLKIERQQKYIALLTKEIERNSSKFEEKNDTWHTISINVLGMIETMVGFIDTHVAHLYTYRFSQEENCFALDTKLVQINRMKNALQLYTSISNFNGKYVEIDMGNLLSEVVSEVGKQFQMESGVFTIDAMPTVIGYESLIRALFYEIVKNAFENKSHKTALHIHIGVEQREDMWQFTIQDNGIGATPQDLERIFNPYFTTRGGKFAGIGLALCKKIVELHNGRIWATSTPNEGTKLWFTLPV